MAGWLPLLKANFGVGFVPIDGRKLAPWPARSKTFDASARLPIKLPPGSNINKQIPRPRQILNMVERGVDESETPLIALGDMAFDSAYIFGEPVELDFEIRVLEYVPPQVEGVGHVRQDPVLVLLIRAAIEVSSGVALRDGPRDVGRRPAGALPGP